MLEKSQPDSISNQKPLVFTVLAMLIIMAVNGRSDPNLGKFWSQSGSVISGDSKEEVNDPRQELD